MGEVEGKMNKFLLSSKGDLIRSGLAEFMGTAILVLYACTSCALSNIVATAFTFGLTVFALASSIGHVSGCHVNPGVTVGMLCNGKIDPIRAVVYFIAQMVGGVAGAGLIWIITPDSIGDSLKDLRLCPTKLSPGVNPVQGIVIEAIIVFLLVFVVCNVCESNPNLAPITIGLTVTVGHFFAIPLTSSSMNTARSFGPALISGIWENHYVYWIGPLLGGALGGLTHRFLFMNKDYVGGGDPKSSGAKKSGESVTNV